MTGMRHFTAYIDEVKEEFEMRYRPLGRGALIVLAVGLVVGCQQFWRESGVWDIGEHQGLLLDVSNYYHRHATEEGGRCISPYIDGVTDARTVDRSEDRIDVSIRYYYLDFLNDGLDDCDPERRPLRCTVLRECRGFATRDFSVTPKEGGYEVIDMTGEQRRR